METWKIVSAILAISLVVTSGIAVWEYLYPPTTGPAGETLEELAKAEGSVNFMCVWSEPNFETAIDNFEAKYGITVEYFHADTAQVPEMIAAEFDSGVHTWDLVAGMGSTNLEVMAGDGYLLQYYPEEAEAYPEDLKDPRGFHMPESGYVSGGIAYNEESLTAEEIAELGAADAWEQLATDPKWYGRLGLRDFAYGGAQTFWVTLNSAWGEEKASQWASDLLDQDPFLHIDDLPLLDLLARGEFDVLPAISGFANIQRLHDEGSPIMWAPGPRTIDTINIGVLRESPHPNAAKLLLEYLLSEEGAAELGENIIVTRPNLETPTAKFLEPWERVIVPNPAYLLDNYERLTDVWLQIKSDHGL